MAKTLDENTLADLVEKFHVSEEDCNQYARIYNNNILPRIHKKYLAHMVTSVEEMIDEKVREKEKNKKENPEDPSKKETETQKVRRYSIVLSDRKPPKNGKSRTWSLPQGAIISYEPKNDPKDLRVYVAHELGHLLMEYGILPYDETLSGKKTEKYANLLAYFAISGKNEFYKDTAPKFVYCGGELEIINRIQTVCPIPTEEEVA